MKPVSEIVKSPNVVNKITSLYAKGMTLNAIASELYKDGVTDSQGFPLITAIISRVAHANGQPKRHNKRKRKYNKTGKYSRKNKELTSVPVGLDKVLDEVAIEQAFEKLSEALETVQLTKEAWDSLYTIKDYIYNK